MRWHLPIAVRECCNSKVKLVRGTSLEEANTAMVAKLPTDTFFSIPDTWSEITSVNFWLTNSLSLLGCILLKKL